MTHAIIGNPVNHSLSPKIYNHLFDYFGIDRVYEKSENLNIMSTLEACNITYPFKKDAFILCDKLTKEAKLIGSVNTIINRNGQLKGTNTDGIGFVKSISEFKEITFILIIGAGATSKAASIALKKAGYIVAVANRSSIPLLTFEDCLVYPFNNYNKEFKPDLVVNMTPVGLEDNEIPFPQEIEEIIKDSSVVIDLIYNELLRGKPFIIF